MSKKKWNTCSTENLDEEASYAPKAASSKDEDQKQGEIQRSAYIQGRPDWIDFCKAIGIAMEINHIYAITERNGPCIKAFPKGGGEPLVIDLAPVHVLQLIKQLAFIAWANFDITIRGMVEVTPGQAPLDE
jgi:hypothetical protein